MARSASSRSHTSRASTRSSRHSYGRYGYGGYGYGGFPPYVSVAEKKQRALEAAQKLVKAGRKLHPIEVVGRDVCHTWWGLSWCRNLEHFGDYENRLPRGRSYVRTGSVIDLQIAHGRVKGLVQGNDLYEVEIRIKPLAEDRKNELCERCASDIGSTIDLLSGKLDRNVMNILAEPKRGLFPEPRDIEFTCSCPDYASVCKHVAAVLYGIGVRFDTAPELFFKLRGIDPDEFASSATAGLGSTLPPADPKETLVNSSIQELGAIFGIDFAPTGENNADTKIKLAARGGASAVPMPAVSTPGVSSAEAFVESLFDPISGKPIDVDADAEGEKKSRGQRKPVRQKARQSVMVPTAVTKKSAQTISKRRKLTTAVTGKNRSGRSADKTIRHKKQSADSSLVNRCQPRQMLKLSELRELGIPYSRVQKALLDGHLEITAWRGEYRCTRTTTNWLKNFVRVSISEIAD